MHAPPENSPPNSQPSSLRTVVLAAVDGSAASPLVLETALRLGETTRNPVEALHVPERAPAPGAPAQGSPDAARAAAARAGVPFRLVEGVVEPVLLAAAEESRVLATVLGGHHPEREHPVGHTTRHLLERTSKPILVVPAGATPRPRLTSVLIPLEGTEASSRAVLDRLVPLLGPDSELVVLHVFTEETRPRMLDRPDRDLDMLGKEFLSKHLPHSERIVLESGPVASRVADVAAKLGTDLIVLSWAQDSSPGRARIVRAVVRAAPVPVLLLPSAHTVVRPAAA